MPAASKTVRGLVHRGATTAPLLEELRLAGPAEGEVQVRMVASGVCHSDLHVIDGEWERPADVVMGHEGAAIVEVLGPGVTERDASLPLDAGGLHVGDLVALAWTAPCGSCPACVRGQEWLCAAPRGSGHRLDDASVRLRREGGAAVGVYSGIGTFCDRQVVAAEAAIAIDPRTPAAIAALIGCAAATGVGAVRNTAVVRAGESVVVIGLGGVGLSVLIAAIEAGAGSVIAVDLEDGKRELARSLGASMTTGPDALLATVSDLPSGGADHVFECIGLTATVELALDATRAGGTTTIVGMTPMGHRIGLDVYRFVEDGKRLLGSNYGSVVPARDFPRIATDVVEGRLPLQRLVTESISLDDVGEAFEAMRRRDGARRVVIF